MEKLSSGWDISDPGTYLATVLLCSLGLRIALSLLAAAKFAHDADARFIAMAWGTFVGFQSKESKVPSNYWYTFILGTFELCAYPVMIVTGAWQAIGAWVGLKTLAQWASWATDRSLFNLFLIGNAAVLAVAFFILTPFVSL
jgi:hypothetical protein